MNRYVADTHALFWHLTDAGRLGSNARLAFAEALAGDALVFVPAIVVAELYYLAEKRGRAGAFQRHFHALRAAPQFVFVPLEADDIMDFDRDGVVPEMHDRIIVGVARRAEATLLTRDAAIKSSGAVKVLW